MRPRAKPLSIVGRQSIGAKAAVAVVEFEGRRFLLGVTEHGISVLDSSAPAVEDEAVAVAPDARFADALDAATLPADAVPLAGSILSAGTWKQAYSALRQAR
nr:flagellar biosynthetic protein FliO [Galbitalea soli]